MFYILPSFAKSHFGFSGNLAKFYLTKDIWDTDVGLFGIDNCAEWGIIRVKEIKDLLASE